MPDIKLNINGIEIVTVAGTSVLDAARENGIEIETLCHDERVKTYGACGLCVVEAAGSPKLLRACSTEVQNNMIIRTDTERVNASRRTALELLLSDHTGDCRPPCTLTCPGGTDCQGYVGLIANGQFSQAAQLIREQLPLPASIGRVCPHPCEDACRWQLAGEPINIAMLKSVAADYDLQSGDAFIQDCKADNGKRVAVVGGGPGGLTAAYFLRKEGIDVTVYDKMPKMGGMLRYGIPEYRLPKRVLDSEVAVFAAMGIKMINDITVGKDISLRMLTDNHDAVLLAPGAWTSVAMRVEGEDLPGVIGGIDFLRKAALGEPISLAGKRIAVTGGGNTAMDAARTAVRLGAEEVTVLYRRTRAEMPAVETEITEAEEEGVAFRFLSNPLAFLPGDDGRLASVRLQKMELGEPDASGRRRPVPVPGAEETIEVDMLIVAIGQIVNPEGLDGIALTKWKTIAADEHTYATNIEGVFAFGDATNNGASIAIEAIGEAKKAAGVVLSYLDGAIVPARKPYAVTRDDLTEDDFADTEDRSRVKVTHRPAEARKLDFDTVTYIYSPDEAVKEAARCLECGCHAFFTCKLLDYANRYDVKPARIKGERHQRREADEHPYITRNVDKCILCGLCVRACDEVLGVGAFGLVGRGFDTVVRPALDLSLEQAGCISCGQCVSLCPTGALGEKLPLAKQVPLKQEATQTVCSFCGVGCKTDLWSKGNLLLRSTFEDTPETKGYLCVNGKFRFAEAQKNRLTTPLINRGGTLEPTGLDEALAFVSDAVRRIALRYGTDAVAVSLSGRLSLEEMYLIKSYAQNTINTSNILCSDEQDSGLAAVLGTDLSTCTFEEMEHADVIVLAYTDIMQDHAVAGIRIRKAVENGAKLIVLNDRPTLTDEWACLKEYGNSTETLGAFANCLIGLGAQPSRAAGFEAFAKSVSALEPGATVRAMAELYYKAKNAVIVCAGYALSFDAAALLAEIAVVSGHIARPRNGIVNILQRCNSAGARALGIGGRRDLTGKNIKALVCFGGDIPPVDAGSLALLAVFDTHMRQAAERADVVIPLNSFAESDGTYISTDRKMQERRMAIEPLIAAANLETISALSNNGQTAIGAPSLANIQERISVNEPGLRHYHTKAAIGGHVRYLSPVLHQKRFATDSGLAEMIPFQKTTAVTQHETN